ncbi:Light-independent protochlorophyllide reductase subunit B [Caprobacter fermentans]|uniref:Light-independent protochlorophyllide reductase subunit B n=1 Tax=Caproicibacter fermentans TaxID=2576756 RepID=A0A6N8HZB7_9FIRM|nr:nitrogenase component 1 [Caproicibacter fermentans]MVB11204.1 Light-independent protochlorophyllide reductase subunit B [Caproicibacter fermentans]
MGANLVQLNVNPCKMCMPMGSLTAFFGIRGCMTILHGSQGCSTYIRRHMATHYNEPVDIASSSLTEQGTVFGGADNLIRGLENLIQLYHPEVIGVATSCLAETIGEDVPAIVETFRQKHPELDAALITVPSAGYSGTQYEGFFRTLRAVVSQVEMDTRPNGKVNVITGMISPADTRWLKSLLEGMGVEAILLPDLSENLDGGHGDSYSRLPMGGTPISEIGLMGGARMTLELSAFQNKDTSPARVLNEKYGVPFLRLPLPCGLAATDALIRELKKLGGTVSEGLRKERERYLDAMIDSHKYNALARPVICGEPDFVRSVVGLCCENGAVPVVAATGSDCKGWEESIHPQIEKAASVQLVKRFSVLNDADFDEIEHAARENGANLIIGSSDARRAAANLGLDLVRHSFPVHDHVGGQRLRMLGYEGSLQLLDRMTNTLLSKRNSRFRGEQYEKYYRGAKETSPPDETAESLALRTAKHPCFTCAEGKYARMHLPVAPECNIQCGYCVRKFDCPNESRPGVTSGILTPEEALEKYKRVKEKIPNLTVAGIAGPGDALANFPETSETLRLIRAYDPDVTFCLSTNGLMLPLYAQELVRLGVTHVTVTLNTVSPETGAKIYSHIDFMGKRYYGEEGASILLANQLSGLKLLCSLGVVCKINIVLLSGINENEIAEVVRTVKQLGAKLTNIMQLVPVKGSAFEHLSPVPNRKLADLRRECGKILPQMLHCRHCRADAIGTLDNDRSIEFREKPQQKSEAPLRFAVAARDGKPEPTCEADAIPEQKLSGHGIRLFTTYDKMEHAVKNGAKQMTGGIET